MTTKSYIPENVSVIIGAGIIQSWNEVTIEMAEDRWTFKAGTTGEVTRTKNANKLGTITLKIPQTSTDNAVLSALYLAGAQIPCLIKDNEGTSIHTMPAGTLVKMPNAIYGKESGEIEWQIKGDIPDAMNILGGNN